MIFLFAGHVADKKSKNYDPGAISPDKKHVEAEWAVRIRNRVQQLIEMDKRCKVVIDSDSDSLSEVLAKAVTGTSSVVIDIHLDAAENPAATGCSVFVADESPKQELAFGAELGRGISAALGIKLRDGGDGDGIRFEAESHRKRLAVLRENGMVALIEVGFITNPNDMAQLSNPSKFEAMCQCIAQIAIKYDLAH